MKEIKFRAWLPVGPWNEEGTERKYEMVGPDALAFEEYKPLAELLAGCENLMQFTDFHDKNGQEAYRDDIIETPYYIMGRESGSMKRGVIEFKDGCFGIQDGHEFVPLCNLRVPTKTEYIPNYGEKAVEFEIPWVIIGNIWEHSDLLEVPHK